ncbi:hypothetical protein CRG98_043687 [Punica granatum]|uniref:Uncharacterized protein n=1 Tax=Punica granatum TaxID=22663 RepID=A0A2I0HWD0_PUNGR|nr:hypothetical protein CRG98_043687 [Punica granatum]
MDLDLVKFKCNTTPPGLMRISETKISLSSVYVEPLWSAQYQRFISTRRCDPTPKAYGSVLRTLSEPSRFLRHIPAILGHLEAVEKFETSEPVLIDLMKSLCHTDGSQEAVHPFCSIPKFRCVSSVRSLDALLSTLCRPRQGLELVPRGSGEESADGY